MKVKDIKSRLSAIGVHVERTRLIDKCFYVAKEYGDGQTEVNDSWTNSHYIFNSGALRIEYNDGLSMMGGGYILVDEKRNRVFELHRSETNPLYPKADGFEIRKYMPGNWEERIIKMSKRKPKEQKRTKKENPLEAEVSPNLISDIKKRFRI